MKDTEILLCFENDSLVFRMGDHTGMLCATNTH